jgi:hypothetical protein
VPEYNFFAHNTLKSRPGAHVNSLLRQDGYDLRRFEVGKAWIIDSLNAPAPLFWRKFMYYKVQETLAIIYTKILELIATTQRFNVRQQMPNKLATALIAAPA